MIPGAPAALMMASSAGIPTDYIASWTSVSGNTLVDDTGVYNGTIYGSPAVTNNIITFSGAGGQYVKVPSFVIGSKVVTISAKFSILNYSTNRALFETGISGANNGLIIYGASSGSLLTMRIYRIASRLETKAIGTDIKHCIFTFDNPNNDILLYDFTGAVPTTITSVGVAADTDFITQDFYIGGKTNFWFAGDLYPKTRIYNRALTEAERTALFNEV